LDVKYEPIKDIVVFERSLFSSPEDLARFASISGGGSTVALLWAEEVVFTYFPLPPSTETVTRALIEDGRTYWNFVGYAIMKNYQPIIETKEKMIVPVINISSNKTFRKVAEWMKNVCYPADTQ